MTDKLVTALLSCGRAKSLKKGNAVADGFMCGEPKGLRSRSPRIPKPASVRALCGFVLVCAISSSAVAQTQAEISAQEYQRRQERERLLRQQQEQKPDVRLERTKVPGETGRLPIDEKPCFKIDRLLLEGDSAEQFQWALKAGDFTDQAEEDIAIHRCLGSRGINQIMRRVQNAIIQRGYVTTRVLAAPQDLNTGTLKLTVIPGRIRTIRFAGGTDERATKWNALPAQSGDLLNLRDIEQGLENFKRIPTADADIQITPAEGAGAKPGESDVVIKWKQGFPFRVSVSADDSGAKATGKYQGSVTVSYDHWWTLNDLFYVSHNHDLGGGNRGPHGTRGYTIHYSVPLGYWLLAVTSSKNNYHQAVAGATQTYIYSGNIENSDIKLSRLIYRDAVRKTTLSLRGWHRTSKNYIDDTEVEVQRRSMAGWEVGASHREFIGASALDANLNYKRGTGAMDSRRAPEEAFDEGTSRPSIITADVQLAVPFAIGSQRLRYTGMMRAQWNRTQLVPQDRFSIGGRYTVRGFDGEMTLSADRGWLIRNDVGITIDRTGQELYAGIDHGEVSGPSSGALIGTRLTGAVLGMRGGYKGASYDVFIGKPLEKPHGFKTACETLGFNLNWSF